MGKFIACLLGGWFGLHKFMEKKIGLGILYVFTLGLFGVGWLIDCITYLVKWLKPKEPVAEPVTTTKEPERVKVTDLDGSVRDLPIYLTLDQNDRVLVAESGKTYHTHLGCFKNWRPETIESFGGWKIIKKSEALANNLRYCSFCKENDMDMEDDEEKLEES